MFKNILVALTGFESDNAALDTAYLAGRAFDAHIEALHVRSDTVLMAMRGSAYDLATAATGAEIFAALEEDNDARSKASRVAFGEFCSRWNIAASNKPDLPKSVTAQWREMKGEQIETTTAEARFYDLVVLGRPPQECDLSIPGMGAVLVGSGRPLLIAPARSTEFIGATVAIAWKDSPEAARALTAAAPLLSRAGKLIVLTASEDDSRARAQLESAERIAMQLQRNGLIVETRLVMPAGRPLPEAVLGTAGALGADLLVMGGYGHSRVRELVFGGFTRQVMTASPLPVFLFH